MNDVEYFAALKDQAPVKMSSKICCCCGGPAKGKQWFNRDKGYGICRSCIERIRKDGKESEEEIEMSYGVEGVNY